jgi:hypothetical protein
MAISPDGKGRVPEALWPINQPRRFVLSEQQEVSDNGTTLWTYPENPNKAEEYRLAPGSPQGPVPQQSTANPPAPQPPPPTTSPAEARRQAELMQACIKQAIARGGPQVAVAIAACNQRK